MRRSALIVALCVLAISACGRSDLAISPVAGPPLASFGERPNTLHVVPFFDFEVKTGYFIGNLGGRGGLIGDATALYGTTNAGGNVSCSTLQGTGCGVVYELSPKPGKSTYKQTILHSFGGVDGAAPDAALLKDTSGNLFGTTFYGGKYGMGTVFELVPTQSGYTESVVHSFGRSGDGAFPAGTLIEVSGTLYGTTCCGGTHKKSMCKRSGGSPDGTCGTVFSVNPATGKEVILHDFGAGRDGASPFAGLIYAKGTFYGTTDLGGTEVTLCGTVFRMGTSGDEQILHSFRNTPNDGCNSFARLIDVSGTLYGTTCCGGKYYGAHREGTIFSVDSTTGEEHVLHSFGSSGDGSEPEAGLTDVGGTLYGTTGNGGAGCGSYGCGTVFSLVPTSMNYKVLHRFRDGINGGGPVARLLWADGSLYGTTSVGGKHNLGTAFKLTP